MEKKIKSTVNKKKIKKKEEENGVQQDKITENIDTFHIRFLSYIFSETQIENEKINSDRKKQINMNQKCDE